MRTGKGGFKKKTKAGKPTVRLRTAPDKRAQATTVRVSTKARPPVDRQFTPIEPLDAGLKRILARGSRRRLAPYVGIMG